MSKLNQQAIKSLVKSCFDLGIREYVVCSGARNSPLSLALLNQKSIQVWQHFEERSAGFFALGRTQKSKEPCAVVVTSGTALAELFPSIIEAYYQNRPLVIISADHGKEARNQAVPQAINQVGLFGNYVENCIDSELGEAADFFEQWSKLKPWHINISLEIGDWECVALAFSKPKKFKNSLPQVPKVDKAKLKHFLELSKKGKTVVLVGGLEGRERQAVYDFLKYTQLPFIADPTSGLRERLAKQSLIDGDRLLSESPPSQILRIGDVPIGNFWRNLGNLAIPVCSITRTGFSGLSRDNLVINSSFEQVLSSLDLEGFIVSNHYQQASRDRKEYLEKLLLDFESSEPAWFRVISKYASYSDSIYLGNSLPIREWQWFAQTQKMNPEIFANRGANGIDGQISTWLGNSAKDQEIWGIFGDLTTLYDMASLFLLKQVKSQRRVLVVINNGGGQLFSRLKGFEKLSKEQQEKVVLVHQLRFDGLAKLWNMKYLKVSKIEELANLPQSGDILLEVMVNKKQTQDFWKQW